MKSEETKLETESKTVRLPKDVVEAVERWANEGEKSFAGALVVCVRAAMDDEKDVLQGVRQNPVVLQNSEDVSYNSGDPEKAGMEIVGILERRGMDADGSARALGIARSYFYRRSPEFQAAKVLRDAGKLAPSVYEREEYQVDGKLP